MFIVDKKYFKLENMVLIFNKWNGIDAGVLFQKYGMVVSFGIEKISK
jgi:hypothetical protein